MDRKNGDLTTGDVGRLCHVSYKTAANWIDRGMIAGYRLPNKARRVKRESLVAFIREHGLPMPVEGIGERLGSGAPAR